MERFVKGQKGFSLVELMVAMAILLIALLPILGSMYGILYSHRILLDKEIAIGIARSIENILDSQEDFYTYDTSGTATKVVPIRDIWKEGEQYPIILHRNTTTVYSQRDYVIEIPTNNKIFYASAFAMKNPPVCDDISQDPCSSMVPNDYLYAVRIVVKWREMGKTSTFTVVRRFYKP